MERRRLLLAQRKSGGTEITFYIAVDFFASSYTPQNALEGMTWRDWVNSEYNKDGYEIVNDSITNPNLMVHIINDFGVSIRPSEEIIANAYYDVDM